MINVYRQDRSVFIGRFYAGIAFPRAGYRLAIYRPGWSEHRHPATRIVTIWPR
jgi:hypothetical protein